MTTVRLHYVSCNHCGTPAGEPRTRRRAQRYGPAIDACPECQPAPTPPTEETNR